MKTRKDELQDLFYAVKRYLVKQETIEHIKSLRDVFIQ